MPESSLHQSLQQWFGFTSFRPGQEATINALLAGRSAAAVFPTGSGKSLCYQLSALHRPHLTLVVSPLLALMQDQLDYLQQRGLPAASIDSTRSPDQVRQIMQDARQGTLKILMVSVERLKNERFRQFLSSIPVSLLVIDEAHCISEWGHNFRPDYLKLPDYQREFAIPQALLLTATATPKVLADMQARFAIEPRDIITTGFYRANLDLAVQSVVPEQRLPELIAWLFPRRYDPSVVYVTQQKTADTLAAQLRDNGINAVAYHAGLPAEQREQIQQGFMNDQHRCIVATIAFGMGIDKRDIRSVVHYDLPKSIENYCQEIGRAGRDGEPAQCLVLGSRDNIHVLENFIYGDTPGLDNIRRVLQQIRESGPQWEVVLNHLSNDSNIRQLPLKTLLVYLEVEGIIKPQYSYFAEYRLQYVRQPADIIDQFEGERQQFIRCLFNNVRMARTWGTLDIDAVCQRYQGQADRGRVIKALNYFQEHDWIVLESKQMTEVFRVTNNHFVLNQQAETLHQLFTSKEQADIDRIHEMIALFESEECLSHQLSEWFGDTQAPQSCGHCSACRHTSVAFPVKPVQPPAEQVNIQQLLAAAREKLGEQADAATLTRFLCGLPAPVLNKVRARSMPGFAALEQWPYQQVYKRVDQLIDSAI